MTTFEQFQNCLGNPVARRNLGLDLDLTDEQAALLVSSPSLARTYFDDWQRKASARGPAQPAQTTIAAPSATARPQAPLSPYWNTPGQAPQPHQGARPMASPTSGARFPFRSPWSRDWVFWYAVVVMVLSAFAFLSRGAAIDLVLGLPLNFLVFVCPVALVAYLVRRSSQH